MKDIRKYKVALKDCQRKDTHGLLKENLVGYYGRQHVDYI